MSHFKKRRVEIHVVPRKSEDSWKFLQTIEITIRGEQVDIEVQEQNTFKNGEVDSHTKNFSDIRLEEEVVDEVRNRLDELAEAAEESKKQNKISERKKEVSVKRRRIRTWLKEIAKEGYRITVKSFFDALLDKSNPM